MEIVKEHIANKVSAPKLRFKEFNELMDKHEFSELVEKRNKTHNPINDNTNYKCIELESLSQETGILLNTFETKNLKSTKTKFKSGDVLFGKLRPYLKKFHIPKFDGVCTSEIWVLNGIKLQNKYLYQLIQTPKFNIEANITSGSKMPRADWNYISSIKYYTPTLPEQEKIASFLSAVDERIQKLERKKSLLAAYKKGVMRQLFSQELRFKDEHGNNYPDWEEKKLGEVGEIVNGLTYSPNDIGEGGVLVLRSSNVQNRTITFNDNVFVNTSSFNAVKKDDVLICVRNGSKRLIGKNAIITTDCEGMAFGAFMTVYRSCYNPFLFHWFDTDGFKNEVHKNLGATINSINGSDLKKFKIPLPCVEEQQKTANFLSALDVKIEAVNAQIENTQAFKKGLLQQMFV